MWLRDNNQEQLLTYMTAPMQFYVLYQTLRGCGSGKYQTGGYSMSVAVTKASSI